MWTSFRARRRPSIYPSIYPSIHPFIYVHRTATAGLCMVNMALETCELRKFGWICLVMLDIGSHWAHCMRYVAQVTCVYVYPEHTTHTPPKSVGLSAYLTLHPGHTTCSTHKQSWQHI